MSDLKFTYTESKMYSGFMVSRDPGAAIIWSAAALFLTGICLVFYFPRREIQAYINSADSATGGCTLSIYSRGKALAPEHRKIEREIHGLLQNEGKEK